MQKKITSSSLCLDFRSASPEWLCALMAAVQTRLLLALWHALRYGFDEKAHIYIPCLVQGSQLKFLTYLPVLWFMYSPELQLGLSSFSGVEVSMVTLWVKVKLWWKSALNQKTTNVQRSCSGPGYEMLQEDKCRQGTRHMIRGTWLFLVKIYVAAWCVWKVLWVQ